MVYQKRSHKQTPQTLKPSGLSLNRVPSSRYYRRLGMSIFVSGPIVAAGLMTAVYSAVAPNPDSTRRPAASSRQKDPTGTEQPTAAQAPVDVRINGEPVEVPASGTVTKEVPIDNGSASVNIQADPTPGSARQDTPAPEKNDQTMSSSTDVDIQVYGTGSSVELDISQQNSLGGEHNGNPERRRNPPPER